MGVTTWIRTNVRQNVRFRRPPAAIGKRSDRGTASRGVVLGRLVDQLFKGWCLTGKVGKGRTDAVARTNHAVAAMRRLRLSPVEANVFVKRNGIKTHLDALAVDPSGRHVVVELKSTQSTAAAHRVDRDQPCLGKPTTRFGPNTESLHHRLQTAFGVHAHGRAAYGVVVVACRDDAVTTVVPRSAFPASAFTVTAAAPPAPVVLFDWPAAAAAALPKGGATRSACGNHAVLPSGGAAVAVSGKPCRANKQEVVAATRHLAGLPAPHYVVFPDAGRWRRRCIKR